MIKTRAGERSRVIPIIMKKTHTRVTARVQGGSESVVCMARLVEEENLEQVERVFKTFGIEYDVDEIASGTRLYSLTLADGASHISSDLLTREELSEHLAPYLRKGGPIGRDELKGLIKGETPEIKKTLPGGKIIAGYELTLKGDAPGFKFRFPAIKFGRKKKAAAD